MSQTQKFDLIVIGAGPAGAACACAAAKQGLKTALVDKARFPRDKLCGGGLTGRAVRHYGRIFGRALPDVPMEWRDRFEFHAFGEDLDAGSRAPSIHLMMRYQFDATMVADALDAGAEDFTGQTGTLDLAGPEFVLRDGRLSAPLIVAADGVNSAVAKQLFGRAFDQNRIGFALEVEQPGANPDTPLRIDFGAAEWGYGWVFPKPEGTTIGLGGVMSRNPDMKKALSDYLKQLGVTEDLKVKGQFLPFGDYRKIPGQGRVLLAGDAAGLVDPVTGEGIAHALNSGELAALACADALAQNAPDTALHRYKVSLHQIHAGMRHARMLRQLMFRPGLRNTFIRSFRRSGTLKADYLRLLAGETEYGTIMRKLSFRLPGFAWRAIRGL